MNRHPFRGRKTIDARERQRRWLKLLEDIRTVALAGAKASHLDLAAIAGQLRGRKASEAPTGVNAVLFARVITDAKWFCDAEPADRARQGPALFDRTILLITGWPAELPITRERKDIDG